MTPKVFAGFICSINNDLLSFQIEKIEPTFYAGPWVVSHNSEFPTFGDMTLVDLCDKTVNTIVGTEAIILCQECRVDFVPKHNVCENHLLLGLIQKYELTETCLRKIHKLYNELKRYIEGIATEVTVEKVIISIVVEMTKYLKEHKMEFYVKPVSTFKCVEDTNQNYKRFPFWTYGIHRKVLDDKYIFGYIKIDDTHNIPLLCDAKWSIPINIFGNKNIRHFVNRFVLIKQGLIITEIFNIENTKPVSCLIVDIHDILILETIPTLDENTINIIDKCIESKYSLKFSLEHVGPHCIGTKDKEQCWLLVNAEKFGRIFIVLEGPLIKLRQLFSVNQSYTILHSEPKQEIYWKEMRIYKERGYIFNSLATKFLECNNLNENKPELKSIDEALDHLHSNDTVTNISGLICDKTFVDNNHSDFGRKRYKQPFGTPGDQIHLIHFEASNNDCLSVFLSNFDRYMAPVCLVPGMVVNIYKVMPQSGRYYKCTPLTTFELVEYKSRGSNSANLSSLYRGVKNVEDKVFLSLGYMTLHNVIYLSRLKIVTVESGWLQCEPSNKYLEINFILECKDEVGRFHLTLTSENILKEMLNFSNFSYDLFLKALKRVGKFEYPGIKCEPEDEIEEFKYALTILLDSWSFFIFDVPVYVRKVKSNKTVPLYETVNF